MSYTPQVDDYVKWTDSLGRVTEGWVYFVDSAYITIEVGVKSCLLYTSPSPRDGLLSRMPSSA